MWNPSTLWWIAAGGLIIIELLTGTIYLLMMAVGLIAGALAAHLGASTVVQVVISASVGTFAVLACHHIKRRHMSATSALSDRSVMLDIGELVHVTAWHSDATAHVQYRGARWTAMLSPTNEGILNAVPGPHRVVELIGNRLVLEPVRESVRSSAVNE